MGSLASVGFFSQVPPPPIFFPIGPQQGRKILSPPHQKFREKTLSHGLKFGVFRFLLTTHTKTNAKQMHPQSLSVVRCFTCLFSRLDCSRCRWHTHLTNYGYFDYAKTEAPPLIWAPRQDKTDTCSGISIVYLWDTTILFSYPVDFFIQIIQWHTLLKSPLPLQPQIIQSSPPILETLQYLLYTIAWSSASFAISNGSIFNEPFEMV